MPGEQYLATRTLAFLFCDVRGYTSHIEAHGDAATAELVRSYRAVVRSAIGAHGGTEMSTEGDSFFVVFESVAAAVRCGVEILAQTGALVTPILVGVGVHAGEAADTDVGIVAGPVNIAARLCALARAGDLMVTDAVRALTRTAVDVRFQSVGQRRLKGVEEPVVVWRVEVPGAARASDHGRPPRWLQLAMIPAILIGLGMTALESYWFTSDVVVTTYHQRWSEIVPRDINPLLFLMIGLYVAGDLVVTVAVATRAGWASRVIARTMALVAVVNVLALPPWVFALQSYSVRGVGGTFLIIFGVLAMGGCLAVVIGLSRRRIWAVGVGYAVCALFAMEIDLLPVALAGAWTLAARRENALY